MAPESPKDGLSGGSGACGGCGGSGPWGPWGQIGSGGLCGFAIDLYLEALLPLSLLLNCRELLRRLREAHRQALLLRRRQHRLPRLLRGESLSLTTVP